MAASKAQSGLTLVEMVITILVMAVLSSVAVVQLRTSAGNAAQAVALYDTTQKMASNWRRITSNCGMASTVGAASPLLATASVTALDVLVSGATAVNSKYQHCYQSSNVRPMVDNIQPGPNGWIIQKYAFTLLGGGSQPIIAQFSAVPHDLVLSLAVKYGNLQAPDMGSQDVNNPIIRYQPDGVGNYTVQILSGSPDQLVLASAPMILGTASGPGMAVVPSLAGGASGPTSVSFPGTLAPPPVITPTSNCGGMLFGGTGSGSGNGIVVMGSSGGCVSGSGTSISSGSSSSSLTLNGSAGGSSGPTGPSTSSTNNITGTATGNASNSSTQSAGGYASYNGGLAPQGTPGINTCLIDISAAGSGNNFTFPSPGCDVVDNSSGNNYNTANLLTTMPTDTSQYNCIVYVSGSGNNISLAPGPCQTTYITGTGNNISGSGNSTSGSGNNVGGVNNSTGGSGNNTFGSTNTTSGSGNNATGTTNNTGGSGNNILGGTNTTGGSGNNVSGTTNNTSGTGNNINGGTNTSTGTGNNISGGGYTTGGTGLNFGP